MAWLVVESLFDSLRCVLFWSLWQGEEESIATRVVCILSRHRLVVGLDFLEWNLGARVVDVVGCHSLHSHSGCLNLPSWNPRSLVSLLV